MGNKLEYWTAADVTESVHVHISTLPAGINAPEEQ